MPFMQGREVGSADLKAKVLCVTHNSALHDLDDEAIKLATALRGLRAVKQTGEMTVRVDGWKIERWCLKSGFNLLASRWLEPRGFAPDPQAVRVIFGDSRPPPATGLYVVIDPPVMMTPDTDQVGWQMFADERNPAAIVGVYIQLHGLGLIVSNQPSDITVALRATKNSGKVATSNWSAARVIHHPRCVELFRNKVPPGERGSLTVEFVW